MPSEIYVDVPEDYPYKFRQYELGTSTLTRDFGVIFTFVCNRAAKLSDGDVYKVEFNNEAEELLFLLKTPFTVINTDVVERYITTKETYRNETSYRSPRR